MKRVTPADRDAAEIMMGLRDDPEAHGRHKPTNRGRVTCGKRQYKDGFAPCQLGWLGWVSIADWKMNRGLR